MIKKIFLTIFIGILFVFPVYAQTNDDGRCNNMKIKITTHNKVVFATLNDSKAAQDFIALLPLSLTLNDYGQNEKVSDLPAKLSLEGAPSGYTPKRGDIAHYAPWGNFIVFRDDFRYSNSLIKLGEIKEGLDALDHSGPIQVTIDVVNE